MDHNQRDFNAEASTWDNNRGRVQLANAVADALLKELRLTPGMDVLDFGCGTGLLTFRLQPFVRSITGADSAPGMLSVLAEKARQGDLRNVRARFIDPAKGDALDGDYHLVVSSMVLHHIEDLLPLFQQFSRVLLSDGRLAVADLDPDGGEFHESNAGIRHFGFDRGELRQIIEQAGFTDIRDCTAAEIAKPVRTGGIRRFTVFLMTARKREQ
jgi:ubiquinone/menaquinone biosynthesis C-methylase UbiE